MGVSVSALEGSGKEIVLGRLTSANFNITTDQAITLLAGNKRITKIVVVNWSGTSALAAGGFYTATSKGGNAIVSAAQVYTAAGVGIEVLPAIAKSYVSVNTIYCSLTTAEGGSLSGDIFVIGQILI